jgi:hypothetical protein
VGCDTGPFAIAPGGSASDSGSREKKFSIVAVEAKRVGERQNGATLRTNTHPPLDVADGAIAYPRLFGERLESQIVAHAMTTYQLTNGGCFFHVSRLA